MAPVVSTVLLHGQSPGLIRATCAAGLSKCPTEPAPLLEFRPWVTHSIPTLFTLDMSARRKECCANRKIAFHEALYDARVYTSSTIHSTTVRKALRKGESSQHPKDSKVRTASRLASSSNSNTSLLTINVSKFGHSPPAQADAG